MGVEEQSGDQRDDGEPAPRRPFERTDHREVAAGGEQHHQRVHARFGGVPDRERRECEQQQRGPRDEVRAFGRRDLHPAQPPVETPAEEPDRDQRERADDARQRPHRGVAGAEHAHPEVEQHVVQRWRAVVAAARPGRRRAGGGRC